MNLPGLYMGRYLSEEVTRRALDEEAVPLRMSSGEPVVPVPYELAEVSPSLVPGVFMGPEQSLAEPEQRACAFFDRLDALGLQRVAGELREISDRHGGKPLVLVDYEDVLQGDRSLRVAFACWWEEKTGSPVYELADDGSEVHHSEVHPQARFRPPMPKEPRVDDLRFAHNEHITDWQLSHEDIEKWVASRYWQFAKTMVHNPHSYTHRFWGDPAMFERVCQHVREFGGVEVFGRTEYRYYETSDRKLWTMGAALPTTVILNCKFFDPEDQARLAEEQTGKSREELGLQVPRSRPSEPAGQASTGFATPDLFGEEWCESTERVPGKQGRSKG